MRGFSLLELIMAMAITSLLAAIAMPGYRALTQRAMRQEARLALVRLQYLQERHYAIHFQYAGRIADQADTDALQAAARSETAAYDLAVRTGGDDQTFLATARAAVAGPQAADRECHQFSVDQTGRRRSANAAGVWSEAGVGRCWR